MAGLLTAGAAFTSVYELLQKPMLLRVRRTLSLACTHANLFASVFLATFCTARASKQAKRKPRDGGNRIGSVLFYFCVAAMVHGFSFLLLFRRAQPHLEKSKKREVVRPSVAPSSSLVGASVVVRTRVVRACLLFSYCTRITVLLPLASR